MSSASESLSPRREFGDCSFSNSPVRKFLNLLLVLACLLHVAVEAKKTGKISDLAARATSAFKSNFKSGKHAANSAKTGLALSGLNRFEVRDKSGCNREKAFENCIGLVGKYNMGEATSATKTGLAIAKAVGLSVGIAPTIVAAFGAGAEAIKSYCTTVGTLQRQTRC